VVGAGVVGFGAAAGAVTVWVMTGSGLAFGTGALVVPHAARLIPAANTMAGIAITLLNFTVLPSPSTEKPHFTLC
jgi:uncharacterized membrane protein SpoIIM required for sporulation